jgi:DNA-binding NarL/FixJ family response regulator
MIRILLADDHAIVREGIKRMFQLTADVTVVDEASNGGEVLELLRTATADLIFLDMSMPGISGANLITRIVANFPTIPVLVLSMHNEPQIARRALNAGAAGYLTKDSEPEQLLMAIRRIAQGKRYIDPELAEQMVFAGNDEKSGKPHEQLSEREFEIMLLLAKGISLNEIAQQLAISSKTVSTHKMRLMKKLSLNSNADLVRYAVAHHLIA